MPFLAVRAVPNTKGTTRLMRPTRRPDTFSADIKAIASSAQPLVRPTAFRQEAPMRVRLMLTRHASAARYQTRQSRRQLVQKRIKAASPRARGRLNEALFAIMVERRAVAARPPF